MIKVDKQKFIQKLKKKLLEKKAYLELINSILHPSQDDIREELEMLTKNIKK